MHFRRSAAVALAAAALVSGCKKVSQEASPQELVFAAFNAPVVPGGSTAIPTPNDLALQAIPTLLAGSQRTLLQAFVDAGGFPGDQAVGITIPIKRLTLNATTGQYELSASPPSVDPTSLTTQGAAPTVVVLKIDVNPPVAQVVEVDLPNCTPGQIALLKAKSSSGSRAWAPGRYVFAIRGGAGGVRTTTGLPIQADQAIALVAPNKDLSNPNNQPPGGLPPSIVARLEPVRAALWQPVDWSSAGGLWVPNAPLASGLGAFPAVAPFIAPESVAVIGAFEVSAGANAVAGVPMPTAPVDAASGIAPLPLDLLRTASSGTTIALNSAFGAAAQGLTTLDGFSTTAMMLAPVTVPVDASTVHGCSVYVFKLSGGGPALVGEFKREAGLLAGAGCTPRGVAMGYVAQPPPIVTAQGAQVAPGVTCAAAGGCSLLVGLQPAVGITGAPVYLPPLEEATDYAVVITTSVKDMLGRPLQKSTVGKILTSPGFDPVATSSVNGTSLLAGISNETATALRKMREQLAPVLAALPDGRTAADVALAYTFRTQGKIKNTALSLVALPYGFGTGNVTDAAFLSTAAVAQAYGVAGSMLVSPAGLTSVAEVTLTTSSLLLGSPNQGAFVDPKLAPTYVVSEPITALVALPDPAVVPSTCAHLAGFGYDPAWRCAPLVVYSHGLTNSKEDMLPIAAALASRGFVVAAIDAEKHGQRSYCSGATQAAADAQCCPAALGAAAAQLCGNSTCVAQANLVTPVVDAATPIVGVCKTAGGARRYLSYRSDFRTTPLGCDPPFEADGVTPKAACLSPKGPAYVNGNMLVTLNFFRVRDSLRQDVVDKSALVKALAPIGPPVANAFAVGIRPLAVDFQKVYFLGHSYGAISGAMSLAVNPRFTRAVTAAPGATALDVFSNPQSHYNAKLVQLLSGANIAPGSADFLKTLQIGKWILDPADPANFLSYALPGSLPAPTGASSNSPFDPAITGTTATNPLHALFPSQPARDVLVEVSLNDGSVPNAQNTYYAARLGYPIPTTASTSTDSNVQWYVDPGAASSTVGHSNLLDFKNASLTQQAQSNAGDFLLDAAGKAAVVKP